MIVTGDWQDALEPIAIKNFNVGLKEIPAEREMLYDVQESSKLEETYLELGDIGSMGDFGGDVDYDDVQQGYKMQIAATEKAKGIKIQRKFVKTDQLDIVKSLPKMLGLAARRRIASDVFFPYNNAFNTALTTIDGLALCSSAHTSNHEDGTNQSNLGTSAFSAVALEAARIDMKKFLTNRDNKFGVKPDMILCGTDLEEAVYEAINSKGKVDTANNNVNFHVGKYKMLSTEWLDDTNNWFLIDSELMKQMCVWNVIDEVEMKQAEDFDGFVAKYAAYMFYGFGMRDWRYVKGFSVS